MQGRPHALQAAWPSPRALPRVRCPPCRPTRPPGLAREGQAGSSRRNLNQLSVPLVLPVVTVWPHFPSPVTVHPGKPSRWDWEGAEGREGLLSVSVAVIGCQSTQHTLSVGTFVPTSNHLAPGPVVATGPRPRVRVSPVAPGMASRENTGGTSDSQSSLLCLFPGLSGKIWSLSLGSHAQGQCECGATPGRLAAK